MQAIADIVLQSEQPAENAYLTKNSQGFQSSTNSISFADFLNSYNSESKAEASQEKVDSNAKDAEIKASYEAKKEKASEPVDDANKIEAQNVKNQKKIDGKEVKDEKEKTDSVKNKKAVAEKKSDKKIKESDNKAEAKTEKNERADSSENLRHSYNLISQFKENSVSEKNQKIEFNSEEQISAEELSLTVENEDLSAQELALLQNEQNKKLSENVTEEKEFSNLINLESEFEDKKDLEPALENTVKKQDPNSKTKISVQDLRTQKTENEKTEKVDEVVFSAKKVSEDFVYNKEDSSVTMEINSQTAESNMLSLNNQAAGAEGSNFHAMLTNQIQANVPAIVKAGSIVLKDNDKGTINLVLHPDDLGNVKIHISLDGKSVSGSISVNSKEALQVFKENAESLREAFIKQGFDTASFDVSMNNGSANQNDNFNNQFDGNEFVAKRMYSAGSNAIEISNDFVNPENFENFSEYSINIVA